MTSRSLIHSSFHSLFLSFINHYILVDIGAYTFFEIPIFFYSGNNLYMLLICSKYVRWPPA